MKRFLLSLAALLSVLSLGWTASAAPTSGEGWEVRPVAEGVTYYHFSGQDKLSGAAQQVFAIDLDLSNPRYALRFSCPESPERTSDVFLREQAVVAMNACYEASSVVMRTDGTTWSCMPYNTVFTSPVPNWKSEAAVYGDGFRDVRISFDGKGKEIGEQRAFYASGTEANIFTSAPMLIDDYDPVGERFVDPSLTREDLGKLEYEDPSRHQGMRHPRSAIAKTGDNHLILMVVDGRRPGISEGMNARELTRFLVRWFHPRFALNMDGGGSSTLCVRGEGDPQTHVVNYPTDNKLYDHAGERKVSSHFYIVELPSDPESRSFPYRPAGFRERYTLEEAVVLSRHNIRSPLSGKGSVLSRITTHGWFPWTSAPGELSRKGAVLETQMGQFFQQWMQQEGLLDTHAVPREGETRFYANSLQRTIATAQYFSAGMLPLANVTVERHCALGTMDPVFFPRLTRSDETFVTRSLQEIAGLGGNDAMKGLGARVAPQMALMEQVLDMRDAPAAANDTLSFRTDDTDVRLQLGAEPSMTGGLKMATQASDAFVLQYYEEPDLLKAAFGHALSRADWEQIAAVKDWYQDVLFSTPTLAANIARPMLETVLSELQAPGRRFSFLCGHDSNLLSVLSALGCEPFALRNAIEKQTPIGSKLVIGKWKGADGKEYADLNLVYASDAQLRAAPMLDLSNPPCSQPIRLRALKPNAYGLYLLSDLEKLIRKTLASDQGDVTPPPARALVREEVLSDWNKSSGLDCVYDLSPKELTPAPKGYEPVYISHYGRHGSRYAYTSKAYTVLLEMLREGEGAGNLTPKGVSVLSQLEAFWEKAQYQVGDLTPLGWEQHQEIARTMVRSFPTVFAKGSRIDACSSPSVRSIISMTSCCSALSREAPEAVVYAHQGMLDVQATRPNAGPNPFRYQGPETFFPYTESSRDFFYRRFPGYEGVLARLFKDPSAALGKRDAYEVFFNLYMLVAGMNSIPAEERLTALDGLLTREEFAALWESDTYERFRETFLTALPALPSWMTWSPKPGSGLPPGNAEPTCASATTTS